MHETSKLCNSQLTSGSMMSHTCNHGRAGQQVLYILYCPLEDTGKVVQICAVDDNACIKPMQE